MSPTLHPVQLGLYVPEPGHQPTGLLGLLHVKLPQVGGDGILADHHELPPFPRADQTGVSGE